MFDVISPRTALALVAAGLIGVGYIALNSQPAVAAAGINKTINYQGRLLSNTGAVVPDGTYNMEFQIWQGGNGCISGCTSANAAANNGGTLIWTEDWVYGANAPDNRIIVKNGYFSVGLGKICPVDATTCTASTGNSQTNTVVDFNQDTLWLSMNVGDTGNRATFSVANGDGYMIPFKRMSSAVYALNANQLGGLTSSAFAQLAATQSFTNTNTFSAATGIILSGTAASGGALLQAGGALSSGSSSGTLFGANPSSFSGDLINLQVANSTKLKVDASGNLTLGGTSLTFTAGSAATLQAASNQNLQITSQGTGDVVVQTDADTNLQVIAAAAPTTDQVVISNSSQASVTSGVDALQITFGTSNASGDALHVTPSFTGGATNGLTYNALEVDGFSPANAAGADTVNGLAIGNLTDPGATIVSSALSLGTGWDSLISYNGTPIVGSTGILQSAAISGSYTGLTGTGTLTAGALGSGFTTVAAAQGGTGQSTYAIGDLLYASTTSALSRLADVATGSCLISGGIGVAPSWGTCASGNINGQLSNLSGTVAVNLNLSPGGTTNTLDVGTSSQSWRTGYFGTSVISPLLDVASGALTLGGTATGITVADNLNLNANVGISLASGTGAYTQLFTGTTTDALSITANSLTTGSALEVTSTNTATTNTAWSANKLTVTNAQATAAVTSQISGLDVQFTQAPTIAGNNEAVANFVVAASGGSPADLSVAAILNLTNNDTATGNQILVADALKITPTTASNIGNGINFNGTFSGNLIESTNFDVANSGNITNAGTYNTNTFTSSALTFGAASTATVASAASRALTITANAASTWSTSAGLLTVQGAAGISLLGGSTNITIGTSDTTGTQLVLDTKTDLTDPTGVEGGMYYNGLLDQFRCYAKSRWTSCTTEANEYDIIDYTDDFITGVNINSGDFGTLGWRLRNAGGCFGYDIMQGVQNHPGIFEIQTGSCGANLTSLSIGGSDTNSPTVMSDLDYFGVIIKPDAGSTGMHVRAGFFNDTVVSGEASQGVYWSFASGTSANWRRVSRDATTLNATSTGTAYTVGTWYRLEIRKNASGNWDFYMNGTLSGTISANIPSGSTTMWPAIILETTNATNKELDIDWARFRTIPLAR